MPISIVKALEGRLQQNPSLADDIIDEWFKALKGKDAMPAIREFLDRIDGKVVDRSVSINVTASPEEVQAELDTVNEIMKAEKELIRGYEDAV
jgi:hypothetical protein